MVGETEVAAAVDGQTAEVDGERGALAPAGEGDAGGVAVWEEGGAVRGGRARGQYSDGLRAMRGRKRHQG